MIERLRRGAQSGLSYILIGVLIVFFAVFFGVPADGCAAGDGGRTLMAKVDGNTVHTEDVNAIYYRYFRGERDRTSQDDEFFTRQAQALKVVITTHLLAERAEDAGLRVSDEEFANYITDPNRNIEFLIHYGRTGQFDGPFYERYVQHGLRVPISSYEDFKRRELLARKYMVLLDMQANPTPADVDDLNRLRNTRVNLEYVQFTEDSLLDIIGLDDETVAEFIADEQGQQRIQDYFEEHQTDYEEPERVNLRSLRIFEDSENADEDYDNARQRIIDDGDDFASVATELSEDFYAQEGGDMGWSDIGDVQPEIREAIDGASVGDIREVETDAARIIVRIEDREEQVVADLADVQEEIAQRLLRRDIVETRGGELAAALHQRLSDDLSLAQALEALEQEARDDDREHDAEIWASLSVQTTGFFNLEGSRQPSMAQQGFGASNFGPSWDEIPGLGQHRNLAVRAFKLSEDAPLIDDVVEFEDSRAVVRLQEREEPEEELSASQRAELALEARFHKVNELLGPWELFFNRPTDELGHYVEAAFQQGLKDGTVRLYERNSRAAALVRQMAEGSEEATAETIDLDDLGEQLEEDLEE